MVRFSCAYQQAKDLCIFTAIIAAFFETGTLVPASNSAGLDVNSPRHRGGRSCALSGWVSVGTSTDVRNQRLGVAAVALPCGCGLAQTPPRCGVMRDKSAYEGDGNAHVHHSEDHIPSGALDARTGRARDPTPLRAATSADAIRASRRCMGRHGNGEIAIERTRDGGRKDGTATFRESISGYSVANFIERSAGPQDMTTSLQGGVDSDQLGAIQGSHAAGIAPRQEPSRWALAGRHHGIRHGPFRARPHNNVSVVSPALMRCARPLYALATSPA